MKYYQTFTVAGGGSFPLDMLRYDHCWPTSPEAVSNIENQGRWDTMLTGREVKLARYVDTKAKQPTLGRWRSFGWTVTACETQRV